MRNIFVLLLAGTVGFCYLTPWSGAQEPNKKTDDPEKSLASLLKSVKEKENVTVRIQAITDLADFGSKAAPALPDLLDALQTKNEDLRLSAAFTLATIGKASIKPVAELLKARDADTLFYAVWTLGLIGPDAWDTAPALCELMADHNPAVRRKIAFALGRLAGAPNLQQRRVLAVLAQALQGNSDAVREEAGTALAKFGKAAVPTLIGLLKEKNATARLTAATVLGEIGTDAEEAIPLLQERLQAKDSESTRHYAEMLAKIGKAALPTLAIVLKDTCADVRTVAARTLAQLVDGVPMLIDALGDKNVEVRRLAAHTLALGKADKSIVLALAFALDDEDDRVRVHAINGLLQFGPQAKPALPRITEALADIHPHVRFQAYYTLLLNFQDNPKAAFQRGLQSKSHKVRIITACLVVRIGHQREELLPMVVEALDDKDLALKMQAAQLLGQLGMHREKLPPIFVAGLKHKSAGVRMQGAEGLSLMGVAAAQYGPALAEVLSDSDPDVRQFAIAGLRNVAASADQEKIVPILTKTFTDGDADIRTDVLKCAWVYGKTKAIYEGALKDKDDGVRQQAIVVLLNRKVPAREFLPSLIPLVRDRVQGIRLGVTELLQHIGETGVPHLSDLLKDSDRDVRLAVLGALDQMDPRVTAKAMLSIKTALKDESPQVRTSALLLLATLGSEGPAILIQQFPEEKDADIRAQILRVLGGLPGWSPPERKTILTAANKPLLPILKLGMKDPDVQVRMWTVSLLEKLGPDCKEALEAFTMGLLDSTEEIRVWAARLGAYYGPKSWAPLEASLIASKGLRCRYAILQNMDLAKYRAKSGVPLLIECLNDADEMMRLHACNVLRHFGLDAVAALPRLRELTDDTSSTIQEAARLAVKQIEAGKQ